MVVVTSLMLRYVLRYTDRKFYIARDFKLPTSLFWDVTQPRSPETDIPKSLLRFFLVFATKLVCEIIVSPIQVSFLAHRSLLYFTILIISSDPPHTEVCAVRKAWCIIWLRNILPARQFHSWGFLMKLSPKRYCIRALQYYLKHCTAVLMKDTGHFYCSIIYRILYTCIAALPKGYLKGIGYPYYLKDTGYLYYSITWRILDTCIAVLLEGYWILVLEY